MSSAENYRWLKRIVSMSEINNLHPFSTFSILIVSEINNARHADCGFYLLQ